MPKQAVRTEPEVHALFDAHIDIAERLARYYCGRLRYRVELNELRAFAFIGLLDAARRYVPQGGNSRFEYYARVRVRGAIRDGLRSLEWFQRRKAKGDPNLLNVKPAWSGRLKWIVDLTPLPDQQLEEVDVRKMVARALEQLPARERRIMRRHYFEGVPFEQIATECGVTPARVSQLKSRALARLRELISLARRNRL